MPRCCIGELCQFGALELRDGHKCSCCRQKCHTLCGIEDPDAPSDANLTCLDCAYKKKPLTTTATTTPPTHKKKNPPTTTVTTTPPEKQPPPKKNPPKKKAAAQKKKDNRIKKTPKQKAFSLAANTSKPDPLIMKRVAFDIDDNEYGVELLQHFGGADKIGTSLVTLGGKTYLYGTIVRLAKNKKGGAAALPSYDVQWEDAALGDTPIALSALIPAMDLQRTLASASTNPSAAATTGRGHRDIFSQNIRHALLHVDVGEEGVPIKSEDESDDEVVAEVVDDLKVIQKPSSHLIDDYKSSVGFEVPKEDTRFRWSVMGSLRPPPQLCSRKKSEVKADMTGFFETPLSSFLAFVPIKIFRSMATYSNQYAHLVMDDDEEENMEISGARWHQDISLSEMMVFFGILFQMVLRPTPGQSYAACWKNSNWHPYTSKCDCGVSSRFDPSYISTWKERTWQNPPTIHCTRFALC